MKGEILSSDNFYDVIATDYNSYMTDADSMIRMLVQKKVNEIIRSGNILDFGGGTGLDMGWLTANNNYNVFFLEPSEKMRAEAIKQSELYTNKPTFITDHIDFHNWSNNKLPVKEKMDGIVANFAVLNCIRDINTLFQKLALISNKGSYIIATVIDTTPAALFKNYNVSIALRSMLNIVPVVYSNYKNSGHRTYLHSIKHYKKASGNYFKFESYVPLGHSNMAILILSKR